MTAVVAAAVAAVGLGYAALSSHTSASPFATIATEQPVPEATGEWQRSDMTTLAPAGGGDAVRSTAMAVSDGQLSKSLTASFRSAFGDDASVAVANLGGTVIWGYDGRGEAKAWSTCRRWWSLGCWRSGRPGFPD